MGGSLPWAIAEKPANGSGSITVGTLDNDTFAVSVTGSNLFGDTTIKTIVVTLFKDGQQVGEQTLSGVTIQRDLTFDGKGNLQ